MQVTIDVIDENGKLQKRSIRRSCLVKYVDPKKEYPISYQMSATGRENKPAILRGEDLTENQIAELFSKGLL
jgi:hypothetical protein